ncbi:aspartate kinase [Anaeromyxobacter terrae]|uniref:aspartate kinase n=1 Tax=Anaeromyxobacter terrae TaxID=2925406 RepID=UPI001F57FBDF|nr:aspartate kinase [Anaeromyxobacter sp. SG22]
MPVVVQKYGGSSVADVEKMRKVAAKVAAARRAGKDVCVVVSAMGDTTDELLALAKQVSAAPPRRELDMLLTAGERISMALLSMALQDQGVDAISFTGSQSGIITTDAHASARIIEVRPYRVQEELARGKVVIVAGFQGVSPRKEVTTLGRGGSDTTAVALAAALGGDCEIYSDVAGVFSADPRVVPSARRLDALSYDEMQELAQAGAKVLNAQAVEFAKEKGIAIHARSTFGGAEETVVRGGTHPERIAGVATQKELALLGLPAGALPAVLERLEGRGAIAAEIAMPGTRAGLVLALENVHDWELLARALRADVPGIDIADEGLGAVSVVGTGLSAGHRVLREVTGVLDGLGAPARALFTSALRVTAYCDARALPDAARELHRRLIG